MGKCICEKCGKEFMQKSHYTTHMNKKNPCIFESSIFESKIKKMIDNAVKEKLIEIEIKTSMPISLVTANNSNIELYAGTDTKQHEKIINDKLVKDIPTQKIHISKPLLKWVGGKTQIIDKVIGDFPIEINNYREAFLGGGSVLFALLSYMKSGVIKIQGNIYAYDVNEPLIYIYINIQTRHNELYDTLQAIIKDFNESGNGVINRAPANLEEAKIAKENYYYWIRSEYNKLTDKKSIFASAMFLFLNKTCFRGVFRMGPKGFNVPYGHYNSPEIINREHLEEIHVLIQNVQFECCDFKTSLTRVEPDDFVYLDPPYAPETDTSFVGYTANGFNLDQHNELFKLIHGLTDTNKKIMMSNADVSLLRKNFTTDKYNTVSILCKRSINSKNPDAKAKEVIIKNY